MDKPLVTIEELSMLIDKQVDDAQRSDIITRLGKCPISKKIYASMQELTQNLAKGIIEKAADELQNQEDNSQCPDDETLMLLQEDHLSPTHTIEVEKHLTTCKSCLKRLMTEVRSAVSMNNGQWKDLPEHVRNDPRLGGLAKVRPQLKEQAKTLVNEQITSEGEEKTIELEYSLGHKFDKSIKIDSCSFNLQFTPQGSTAVNIELSLYKDKNFLKNSEIVVWDTNSKRKIFRGLSNSEGKIAVRRLHANTYDFHSHELNTTLRIIIS